MSGLKKHIYEEKTRLKNTHYYQRMEIKLYIKMIFMNYTALMNGDYYLPDLKLPRNTALSESTDGCTGNI